MDTKKRSEKTFSSRYKLPERLEQLREKFGISRKKLGEKLGLAQMTVYRWESGEQAPNVLYLIMLCEFFGCTADYLIGLED